MVVQVHILEEKTTYKDALDAEFRVANFSTGLAASICVTVLSELGDKSFIMAAILAMHHSRTLTFLGSMLGHLVMTGVAVGLGMVASLVPNILTKWVSCFCMTFFGLKMLREGFAMPLEELSLSKRDNIIEVHSETARKHCKLSFERNDRQECFPNQECTMKYRKIHNNLDNAGSLSSSNQSSFDSTDGVLMQAFTVSFLGEWGDRSQIATILLASNENPYGVAVGSIFGHMVCSLLAVVCGRLVGQKFPVKTMTQVGGLVFLLCAVSAILFE